MPSLGVGDGKEREWWGFTHHHLQQPQINIKKKNGKKDVFQIPKLMVLLFNSQKKDIKRK